MRVVISFVVLARSGVAQKPREILTVMSGFASPTALSSERR